MNVYQSYVELGKWSFGEVHKLSYMPFKKTHAS